MILESSVLKVSEIKGLFLYWNKEKIVVRKRKEITPKKPIYFLFNLTKKKYVSSLYPLQNNTWQFDYNGSAYLFLLSEHGSPIIQTLKKSLN